MVQTWDDCVDYIIAVGVVVTGERGRYSFEFLPYVAEIQGPAVEWLERAYGPWVRRDGRYNERVTAGLRKMLYAAAQRGGD